MYVVIDIPNYVYESIMNMRGKGSMFEEAVKIGTPLPKGHGRLIDEDFILRNAKNVQTIVDVNNAPTIIEADKGEE
jgi:hypothetical protein